MVTQSLFLSFRISSSSQSSLISSSLYDLCLFIHVKGTSRLTMFSFSHPRTLPSPFPLRSRIVHCCHYRLTPYFFLAFLASRRADLCFAIRTVRFRFAHLQDFSFQRIEASLIPLVPLVPLSLSSHRPEWGAVSPRGVDTVVSKLFFLFVFFFFFVYHILKKGRVRSFPLFIGLDPDRPSWPGSAPGSARSGAA